MVEYHCFDEKVGPWFDSFQYLILLNWQGILEFHWFGDKGGLWFDSFQYYFSTLLRRIVEYRREKAIDSF